MEGSKRLPVSGSEDDENNEGPLVGCDSFHPPASLLGIISGPALQLPRLPAGDQKEKKKKKPARSFCPNFFFFSPPLVQSFNYLKGEVLFPHSKLCRLFLPLVVKVEAAAQAISGVCDVSFPPQPSREPAVCPRSLARELGWQILK